MDQVINDAGIEVVLSQHDREDAVLVREVLSKAREMNGLSIDDVAVLMTVSDATLLAELFDTARLVKETIYGKRMVIFAPMYISNLCGNECTYCAFRARNKAIERRALSHDEIKEETAALIDSGHKRILLVAGESYPQDGFSYVLKAIDDVYGVQRGQSKIRRVNVNIAPLKDDEFAQLKERNIGTYQLFQETYDRHAYKRFHISGKKADYDWRITAIDRAMKAGIDDVGIGILFGLSDHKREVLSILQHVNYLEERFGVGPHTISVPRLEPATGSDVATNPPYPVTDIEFQRIVAVLRLAVPYTGIIMSTRETPRIRHKTFALGVSQISAGSRTDPGGYSKDSKFDAAQFSLGDHRGLDEVVRDLCQSGYIPSFCTGCYRLGRTGGDFMDLAKPGEIRRHCDPNGLSTFMEFLLEYASEETKAVGYKSIDASLSSMGDDNARRARKLMALVKEGKRDVYC